MTDDFLHQIVQAEKNEEARIAQEKANLESDLLKYGQKLQSARASALQKSRKTNLEKLTQIQQKMKDFYQAETKVGRTAAKNFRLEREKLIQSALQPAFLLLVNELLPQK